MKSDTGNSVQHTLLYDINSGGQRATRNSKLREGLWHLSEDKPANRKELGVRF